MKLFRSKNKELKIQKNKYEKQIENTSIITYQNGIITHEDKKKSVIFDCDLIMLSSYDFQTQNQIIQNLDVLFSSLQTKWLNTTKKINISPNVEHIRKRSENSEFQSKLYKEINEEELSSLVFSAQTSLEDKVYLQVYFEKDLELDSIRKRISTILGSKTRILNNQELQVLFQDITN